MIRRKIVKSLNSRLSADYGSLRGFVGTVLHRLFYSLGRYKDLKNIKWHNVKRLVFVCKGNICRSAYAEAVARSMNLEAISCGLDTSDGQPAYDRAISLAATEGIDLIRHKTKKINSVELKNGDLLIAMEPQQLGYLKKTIGGGLEFTILGLWGLPITPYLHDPYGASNEYFEKCFNFIKASVSEIKNNIIESKSNKI